MAAGTIEVFAGSGAEKKSVGGAGDSCCARAAYVVRIAAIKIVGPARSGPSGIIFG